MFSRSFAKERCALCVLLGLISRQKLEKRTEKNGTFLLKNGKEWNVPFKERKSMERTEWKRTQCPTLSIYVYN